MHITAEQARKLFKKDARERSHVTELVASDIVTKVETEVYRASSRKHSVMVLFPELYTENSKKYMRESLKDTATEAEAFDKARLRLEKDGYTVTPYSFPGTDGKVPGLIVGWHESWAKEHAKEM